MSKGLPYAQQLMLLHWARNPRFYYFLFISSLMHYSMLIFCLTIKPYLLVGCRCVICQMEYKRGDRRITLPCKHIYHAGCGTRWLSINKVSCSDHLEIMLFFFFSFLFFLELAATRIHLTKFHL